MEPGLEAKSYIVLQTVTRARVMSHGEHLSLSNEFTEMIDPLHASIRTFTSQASTSLQV